MSLLPEHSKSQIFNHSQPQQLNLQRNGCIWHGTIIHELLHALGFWHMQSATDRDKYVIIHWNNIEPGKVSVCTHNKLYKYAPVPCAHRTHKDITFTAHHCHYYVQLQWLFRQRSGIAEKILDTIWNQIPINFNYINKIQFLHLTVIPPSNNKHHAHNYITSILQYTL